MENYTNIDLNHLPVHLFVKSQKDAKKVEKQAGAAYGDPYAYKKNRKFKPAFVN